MSVKRSRAPAPVTKRASFGAQLTSRRGSSEPALALKVARLFMFVWKYDIFPPLSTLTSQIPLCDHEPARTADWCAWTIVSKLKVSPFHNVNSPEVEPVSSRRPSGVHCADQPLHDTKRRTET